MEPRKLRSRLAPAIGSIALAVALWPAPGAAAADPASEGIPPVEHEMPAGTYDLDRAHASLTLKVDHLGFSRFTTRFTRFDAQLVLDPDDPAQSRLTVSIDPASLETDYPDPKGYDFNADLRGETWLDAGQFPEITYRSTAIELTAPDTAEVIGELSLRGVTRPVTMTVTFNGGYASNAYDPAGSRMGFSARGTLSRSAFGMGYGVPAPGTTMGVGDEVEFIIEAEFTRPTDATE